MRNGKRFLGIIPARGGSRRLPRKNLLPLAGKPLIAWTIEAARGAASLDTVVVSTDSTEIAEVAKAAGAEVPFLRPEDLAQDGSHLAGVTLHAIGFLERQGSRFDYLVLMQPTSPFRASVDIEGAIDLLFAKDASGVVSVCRERHSPLLCNTLPPDGSLTGFLRADLVKVQSQQLPAFYRPNGAIYIRDIRRFTEDPTFYPTQGAYAYIMPSDRSIDIDSFEDLLLAESLISHRGGVTGGGQG